MTNYVRSLRLLAYTGQCLAEILMPDKPEDEPMLLMPTMGMYFDAQHDTTRPHVLTGPARMHAPRFLAYLASIAAETHELLGLEMTLTGESPAKTYCDVRLTRNMQAGDLAEIAGLPLETVRHFLASHLTFEQVAEG